MDKRRGAVQSSIEAAGRFVYILLEKNNDRFMPYVPRTLANVKRNLEKYQGLHTLRAALARHVPELS